MNVHVFVMNVITKIAVCLKNNRCLSQIQHYAQESNLGNLKEVTLSTEM